MLEGHTIRRILPPIIDDVDKYQFAILGSSLRSLGLPVSLWLIRTWRSVKEKNEQKGGRRKVFFFSGLAVFKFGTKVVMLLINTVCQNIS